MPFQTGNRVGVSGNAGNSVPVNTEECPLPSRAGERSAGMHVRNAGMASSSYIEEIPTGAHQHFHPAARSSMHGTGCTRVRDPQRSDRARCHTALASLSRPARYSARLPRNVCARRRLECRVASAGGERGHRGPTAPTTTHAQWHTPMAGQGRGRRGRGRKGAYHARFDSCNCCTVLSSH